MPIRSINLFASQKGGTGKTTLSGQVACSYADKHPAHKVLFMDLTELGDGTKRFFGGIEASQGKENEMGRVFSLFTDARRAEEAEERKDEADRRGRSFFQLLTGAFGEKVAAGQDFKIDEYAMHLCKSNDLLPKNLYLISSGGNMVDDVEAESATGMHCHEDRRRICEALRRGIESSDATWQVFVDTDGDRRPSPFTRLGYLLADFCTIPLQPDECDFQRVEQMIEILHRLHTKGEAYCRIQLVCWNKVQLYKGDPCGIGHFTPPKVSIDTIQHLNKRVSDISRSRGETFAPTFTTMLVKDFPDTVIMPANSNGIPFCRMTQGTIKTRGGTTFSVKKDQIDGCSEGIVRILDAMQLDTERSVAEWDAAARHDAPGGRGAGAAGTGGAAVSSAAPAAGFSAQTLLLAVLISFFAAYIARYF